MLESTSLKFILPPMNVYQEYLTEIEERKAQGLSPKPIDGSELIAQIITQIKDERQ